eukprot:c20386_g1_i1.p1 GENE.c20386_g1_i1~~c20386_g1_i1.p1  ORF type:complete len:947 (-),score=417.33 c20386_g1_i1:84-2924(-)
MMKWLVVVLVIGTSFSLPSENSPPLAVDQSLIALEAEPLLSDPNIQVCHGPEDCNNHGFCDSNNLCRCAPGWAGIDCSVEFTCPNNCSSNGVCRAHTCFCYHGYTGSDCAIALFCPNNCNANGRCDRGRCVCDPGFDGDDCSKEVGCAYKCVHGQCTNQVCVCEEGYYGPDCSDIDYCLTNCSNHGSCKERRCMCDYGFTGVVCSTMIPCPNSCSHKGECVNGTCMCDLGFTGIDCSEDCCPDQNTQCSAGKMCSYPACQCHNDCNGNGICHRGRCICARGFFGDDCAMKYCPYNCSMHGSCDYAVGECTCDSGWKGLDCATVECPNDCSGRGECMLFGGTSRICLCEEGFTGSDCSQPIPCPSDCSGRGRCVIGKCICENGRDGIDCSEVVPPWVPCENDCYNHGRCENGACVSCEAGWEGKFCQTKKIVETKPDGTVKCPGEPECSSHGLCGPGGKCFCSADYLGESCAIKKCPDNCNGRGDCKGGRCMCRSPYHSGPLESCEFISCPNNCTAATQGNCKKDIGKCSCIPPWTGEDCSIKPCPGSPQECSNQGQCDHKTGTCDCLPDYAGNDCSIFLRCPNDCSGNGVCYRGSCYCYSNFTGEACKSIKRPPPPPGFDWAAPLKAAQQLFATSRSINPPPGPVPASFSIQDRQELFKDAYGDKWLRYWNLVTQNSRTLNTFTKAVTSAPLASDTSAATAAAVVEQQKQLFKQVFGDNEWQASWDAIMNSTSTKEQFQKMFGSPDILPIVDGGDARGPGLPPPPPIARDPTSGTVSDQRIQLFTDVFGKGEGLAMEMLIFGNRTKRDLFTKAFSEWLKENADRDIKSRRENWEDDMLQLMTDSIGDDGPKILREIYADPVRASLFRNAFASYLNENPSPLPTEQKQTTASSYYAQANNFAQISQKEQEEKQMLSRLIEPSSIAPKTSFFRGSDVPTSNHRAPPPV